MKKIRFLAIFLVLLMLAMPILTACSSEEDGDDSQGEGNGSTDSGNSGNSGSSSNNKPNRKPGGNSGNISITPDGYVLYEDFNAQNLGEFTKAGNVAIATDKNGVSYKVIDSNNFGEGDTEARVLHVHRNAVEDSSSTDAFPYFQPQTSKLADIYAVEYDIMVTDKTTSNFTLVGRKQPGGGTAKFNNFIVYEANTGKLTANGREVATLAKDTWYKITLMIYDNMGLYDVYVDGYKLQDKIDYATADYYKRGECDINYYRLQMAGGKNESEFFLDNIAIYVPDDDLNRPKEYLGDKSVTYEQINMPSITLFDAANINADNYLATLEAIYGAEAAAKIIGYGASEESEGTTSGTAMNDAFRFEAVSPDGADHVPLADTWGGTFSAYEDPMYEQYLFFDGYNSGFTAPVFKFDPVFMAAQGIPVLTGAEVKEKEGSVFTGKDEDLFYDISNYSTLEIEFYIPEETRNADNFYQFMVYLSSGSRDPEGSTTNGISYFNTALKTNDTRFDHTGRATLSFNIGAMGPTRDASLTTITSIEFRFSGWNNTIGGIKTNSPNKQNVDFFYSDEHPVAIKSIKLSGGTKVPVQSPAAGMENCTHDDYDAENDVTVSLMTEEVWVDADCVNYGYMALKCTACGKTSPKQPGEGVSMKDVLAKPKGHNYGSGVEGDPDYNERDIIYPTCLVGGSATAACLDCGNLKVMETYSALGHQFVTRIDNVKKMITFDCPVCGEHSESYFSEKMPTHAEAKLALEQAGYTLRAGFFGNSDLTGTGADSSTVEKNELNAPDPKINNFDILLRGAKYDILSEGEGNDYIKYIRLYNKSTGHTYGQFQNVKTDTVQDIVLEMNIRMGPMVGGKYPSFGNIWMRNNGSTANIEFAKINDGVISFVDPNATYTVPLSETEFTNVAFAIHFSSNTLDVYVNGVMKAQGITLCTNTSVDVASFNVNEFRFFQFDKANMPDSYIDINNLYAYTASFPAAFTAVELDGVIADYSGVIVDDNFNATEEGDYVLGDYITTEGDVTVADDALVLNGASKVTFNTDKKTSKYVIAFDYKGNKDTVKAGAILRGLKINYYGEDLFEDLITVNEYGDVLFYNQIVAVIGDEAINFVLAINEDTKTLELYVNGTLAATGWYVGADYTNEAEQPVLTGIEFVCADGTACTVDNVYVVTGSYEDYKNN